MKHTKGPWRLIRDGNEPEDGWPVVQFRDWSIFSPPMHCDSLGSQKADAQLIAAAPEMLEALKSVHKCYFLHSEYPKICALVDAAIAKAEGR